MSIKDSKKHPFREVAESFYELAQHAAREEYSKLRKRFIEFHGGKFYCQGKLIDFRDSQADYVKLLEALYFRSDKNGFCGYETIRQYIAEKRPTTKRKKPVTKRTVDNALAGLYRKRHGQKIPFPKTAPDGQPVISKDRGNGLVFHNPEM